MLLMWIFFIPHYFFGRFLSFGIRNRVGEILHFLSCLKQSIYSMLKNKDYMMLYKVIRRTEKVVSSSYIKTGREVSMKTFINKVTLAQSLIRFLLLVSLITLFVFLYSSLYPGH